MLYAPEQPPRHSPWNLVSGWIVITTVYTLGLMLLRTFW